MGQFDDILRDLPAGLTEADLADLVEGTVPAHREPVVIAAFGVDPRVALLVKQLRMDRAQVQGLGETAETAPPGMLEAIEAKLDREALQALVSEADQAPAPIPISQVQPGQRGVIRVLAESVWARRLATAASLAIVAGLGALAVREIARKWPRLPNTVVVHKEPGAGSGLEGASEPDMSLAAEDAGAEATDQALAMNDAGPAGTEPGAEGGSELLSAEEAIALAEAGRLVITVRTEDLPRTLLHLERLSRAGSDDARWRSFDPTALPTELAMLAWPLPESAAEAPQPGPGPQPPTIAAQHGPVWEPAARPQKPVPQVRVKAVRLVRMSADPQRLGDLLRDLNITREQAAKFRAAPAPLTADEPVDAESVLWWSAGNDRWERTISVPIVVETIE